MRYYRPVCTGLVAAVFFVLLSCQKSEDLTSKPMFKIKMNYSSYQLNPERIEGTKNCGIREYDITAYNGDMFFRLTWDCDTLKAGSFTGKYWYTNYGKSYGTNINIAVSAYTHNYLQMKFEGGIVSGCVNYYLEEK